MRKIFIITKFLLIMFAAPTFAQISGYYPPFLTLRGFATVNAPPVSPASLAYVYYDTTSNTLKMSLNGAAYVNIGGATNGAITTGAAFTGGVDRCIPYQATNVIACDANLTYTSTGYVSSTNGFYTGTAGAFWFEQSATSGAMGIQTNASSPGAAITILNGFKNLTESSPTAFLQIPVSGSATVMVDYTILAADATDFGNRSGSLVITCVNKSAVETCTIGRPQGSTTVDQTTDLFAASSANTLTNTFTIDTAPTNAVNVAANAVSSLTQTTLRITFSARAISTVSMSVP